MGSLWWLIVVINIDGTWVAGADMQDGGWSPRGYTTQAECEERRDFARKHFENLKRRKKAYDTKWTCEYGPEPGKK